MYLAGLFQAAEPAESGLSGFDQEAGRKVLCSRSTAGLAERGYGIGRARQRELCHEVEIQERYFSLGPTFPGIAMDTVNTFTSPAAVINELTRMRSLGYFVVDEAFEFARAFDVSDFAGLSVSSLAFIACERGHAEYKSRLRSSGAIDASAK